jgi:2-desacetyl-2-hydroxyethyl bacteriochlorophyllide A dehydrogenase
MNVYRGTAPQWSKRHNAATGLFDDRPNWSYPFVYGYQAVGRVVERGDEVESPRVGDLVVSVTPHQSHTVMEAAEFTVLPALEDPRHGVLAVNTTTALTAVLDARPVLGDAVVVSGLGVIGQLIAQLVRRSGVDLVIGVDASEHRRELARSLGADAVFAPEEDVPELVRGVAPHGADTVIEVSGAAPALQTAIRSVAFGGKVVTVSWYREPIANLNLSDEYFANRVQIVPSNADLPQATLPLTWSDERLTAFAASLVPKLKLGPLFTHEFAVEDAADAYRAVDEAAEGLVQCTLRYT